MSDYSTMMEKAALYDAAVEGGLVPPDWVPKKKEAAPPAKEPAPPAQAHREAEREPERKRS